MLSLLFFVFFVFDFVFSLVFLVGLGVFFLFCFVGLSGPIFLAVAEVCVSLLHVVFVPQSMVVLPCDCPALAFLFL